jgi:hypothetical protein
MEGLENRANEAAKLLYVDMKLGGKTVKAGTILFYSWSRQLHNNHQQRLKCLGFLLLYKANDVARVSVPVTQLLILLKLYQWFYPSDSGWY